MADEGEDKATGTTPPTSEPTPRVAARREQSEWTASDTRGPLSSADGAEAGEEIPVETPAAPASYPAPAHEDATPHEDPAPHEDPTPHETVAAAAPAEAETDPRPDPAPQPEERRKDLPVVPLVLALIVGAIIGAGSAAVINGLGGVGTGGPQSPQVASLGARVDALEKRPDPQPEIDALKADAAKPKGADFDPTPLQQKLADLQSELDALKQKNVAGGALDSKVAALGGSVDALKAQGADIKGLDGKVTTLAAAVDGLKKQDATTQAGLASLQDGQKALAAKVTGAPALAVVADSLVEAIAHGKPYADQVAALGTLGADPAKIAVMKENADKGVPSAQALAQAFAPLADPIIAAANKAPPNAGLMDRLKSGMASMVSVRSAGASEGDDAGSRVSRIEADLAHDDVAGAYATWDGLPADSKAKSDAWGALAKTHVEAMDAAHALQQQAIAALGGRKS